MMGDIHSQRIIWRLEEYARERLIERAHNGELPEILGGPEETEEDLARFRRAVSSLWAEMKAAIDDREVEWLELREAGYGLEFLVADMGRTCNLAPDADRRRRLPSGCADDTIPAEDAREYAEASR